MKKERSLYVYFLPNGDGRHDFMVAAHNQKESCKLIGISVGYFLNCGGRRLIHEDQSINNRASIDIVRREPGRVWKKKIDVYATPQSWWLADSERPCHVI